MCGMVWIQRKDNRPAYKSVLKRYRKQQSRGQEGFGYVAIRDNEVVSYQRTTTEKEIIKLLEKETAPEIFFHHRNPTGTPNFPELAHPFLIEHPSLKHQYFVGHNGSVRNDDDLKKEHQKLGIKYNTEMEKCYMSPSSKKVYRLDMKIWNDSESLAVETALALDGKKKTIDTEGPAAVFGLQTKGTHVVNRFFYRNLSNPLHYHEDKHMRSITSQGDSNMLYDMKVYRIKEGSGFEPFGDLQAPKLYKYEYSTSKVKRVWNKVTAQFEDAKSEREIVPFNHHDHQRSMGFLPHYGGDDIDLGDYMGDSDIEYGNTEDKGAMHQINEVLADMGIIPARSSVLKSMSTATLWDEYTKAYNAEELYKETIARMDTIVEEKGEASDELLDKRTKLQFRLDKITNYMADVFEELTARETKEVGVSG